MALRNHIEDEINFGNLNRQWTGRDLVFNERLASIYKETTLRTDPANQSVSLPGQCLGAGYWAKANKPMFYRVGRRERALLYSLPQHLED